MKTLLDSLKAIILLQKQNPVFLNYYKNQPKMVQLHHFKYKIWNPEINRGTIPTKEQK